MDNPVQHIKHPYTKLFLVGFMGSGKSAIGKRLAQLAGFPFYDTDTLFEQEYKTSIASYFTTYGEAEFRLKENLLIRRLAKQSSSMIVATGGGMPCFHNGIDIMNEAGYSIYLQLPAAVLFSRLKQSVKNRPLLKEKNEDELQSYIKLLLQQREPVYKQATFIVDGLYSDADMLLSRLKALDIL